MLLMQRGFPLEGIAPEWRLVRHENGFDIYDTITGCFTWIEDHAIHLNTVRLMQVHGVPEVDSVAEYGEGPLLIMRWKLKAEGKSENEIRAALKEYLRQHDRGT
jgi:hypothetical protein